MGKDWLPRIGYYKLVGHEPVPCSMEEMGELLTNIDLRRVALTVVYEVTISTVFLCIDHGYGRGKPVLFETMVFGGDLDVSMERYTTWDLAAAGHERWVQRVKDAGKEGWWHLMKELEPSRGK